MSAPNYNYNSPRYSEFGEFRNRKARWKGIWIVHQIKAVNTYSLKEETKTIYECSICTSKFHGDALFPTKYCPNCGAKMEE